MLSLAEKSATGPDQIAILFCILPSKSGGGGQGGDNCSGDCPNDGTQLKIQQGHRMVPPLHFQSLAFEPARGGQALNY